MATISGKQLSPAQLVAGQWAARTQHPALSPARTTQAGPAAVVVKNLLLGQPALYRPNQGWMGDITYLPLVVERW